MIKLLLLNGANPNIATDRDIAPLDTASVIYQDEPTKGIKIIELMLSNGADPLLQVFYGNTIFTNFTSNPSKDLGFTDICGAMLACMKYDEETGKPLTKDDFLSNIERAKMYLQDNGSLMVVLRSLHQHLFSEKYVNLVGEIIQNEYKVSAESDALSIISSYMGISSDILPINDQSVYYKVENAIADQPLNIDSEIDNILLSGQQASSGDSELL